MYFYLLLCDVQIYQINKYNFENDNFSVNNNEQRDRTNPSYQDWSGVECIIRDACRYCMTIRHLKCQHGW